MLKKIKYIDMRSSQHFKINDNFYPKNIGFLNEFILKKKFKKNTTKIFLNYIKIFTSIVLPIIPVLTEVIELQKTFYKLDYLYVSDLVHRKKKTFSFFYKNADSLLRSGNSKFFLNFEEKEISIFDKKLKQFTMNLFL